MTNSPSDPTNNQDELDRIKNGHAEPTSFDKERDELVELYEYIKSAATFTAFKQAIESQKQSWIREARTQLLRDLSGCGEIHHSVFDYRVELETLSPREDES